MTALRLTAVASTAFALGAILFSAQLAAEPALEIRLEPRSVTLGDRIAATLIVRLDAGDQRAPRFPDWSVGWGKLTVLSAPPASRAETAAGVEWRQTLELAAFEVGTLELPEIELALEPENTTGSASNRARVATPSGLAIEVRSLLPPETEEIQPKPAEPPRRLPLPSTFWWSASALALTALALGVLVARHKRTGGPGGANRALSPREELERALAALSGAEPTRALAALSLALRRYLGRTLTLPAAESTTSELAQRLGGRGLGRATVQGLVRLLREVDQVKFARRAANAADLALRIEETRAVVGEVERGLQPPAESSVPAPATKSAAR